MTISAQVEGVGTLEFPDGTSPAVIQQTVKRVIAQRSARKAPPEAPWDPTSEMSGVEKGLAGMGKAFVDLGRGAGTLVSDAFPGIGEKFGLPSRASHDEAKRLDAALMRTGAGTAGNIAGNVAALAPLVLIPGVGTVAGGTVAGALTGALEPVGTEDSRTRNMGINAAFGGAVPLAGKVLQVGKAALVDPFTQAGRERIVGRTLNTAAADADAARQALRTTTGSTAGFEPTVAQASGDSGLSALERAARAIDPAGFGAVDNNQRAALAQALRSVAGTPETRSAAVAARESATKPLYDVSGKSVVVGDAELQSLMNADVMKKAADAAERIASNRREPFQLSKAVPAHEVPTGVLDASGNAITHTVPATPATFSGRTLHNLKMGVDQAIGSPANGGLQATERASALDAKSAYMKWLEANVPGYADANQQFASLSRPINQMDIGQELYNRFVPALADTGGAPFKTRADALAQALRHGDELARNATGMKGATLKGVMEPDQLRVLEGVVRDSQLKAAAENAGRGVGSDTVQKMAMSNLISEAGLPSWISSLAPLRPVGGMLKTAGDILYTKNDETMRHLLADILKDPKAAAKAMEKAGVPPSKIAEFLRMGAQGLSIASPSVVNAAQQ